MYVLVYCAQPNVSTRVTCMFHSTAANPCGSQICLNSRVTCMFHSTAPSPRVSQICLNSRVTCMFQSTAPTPRVSSTAHTTARRTRPSSPWRLSSSTPATPATSRWASLTPSVFSITPRLSGSGPTSPASVSPYECPLVIVSRVRRSSET